MTATAPLFGTALQDKIADARRIVHEAVEAHTGNPHTLVARAILFSGGNDSATLFHLMISEGLADVAIHANTGIGIEDTRQFVRDRCAEENIPLMEEHPPTSYRDLVLEQGFPGPAHHYKMYQRLKERCLRQARAYLVGDPRRERVLFIAGRRRAESARRRDVPEYERDGSIIWASPLANWTAEDLSDYRIIHGLRTNPVAEKLGMSGECLCGAFAEPGELDRIRKHYPGCAAEIEQLQDEAAAAGIKPERCQWGWGAYRESQPSKTGKLCSSCDARYQQTAAIQADGYTVSPELQAILDRRRSRP